MDRLSVRYESMKEDGRTPSIGPPPEQEVIQAQLPHMSLKVPWLKAEDMAPAAAVFPASDDAHMVSGASYDVTGGDSACFI